MGTRAAFPDPWNPVSQPGQESPSAASHWPVCYFDVVHLTDRFFFDFFFSFFFFSFFLFRLQLKRSFLISRSAIRFPYISLFLPIFLLIESYSLLILSPIHIPIPFLIVFEVPWDRQQPSAKREGEGRYTLSFPKNLLEKSTRNRTHSRRSVTAGGACRKNLGRF